MDILPDLLSPNLKVVFCGTAAGKTSAKKGAYYAHSRNRFWRILHECRFTEKELLPEEFRQLQALSIGLTDLCKLASGNDDQLPIGSLTAERLVGAIQAHKPSFLAFTSRTAGRILCGRSADYGWQERLSETQIYILPTTSPRWGDRWWNEKKRHWHDFALAVQST